MTQWAVKSVCTTCSIWFVTHANTREQSHSTFPFAHAGIPLSAYALSSLSFRIFSSSLPGDRVAGARGVVGGIIVQHARSVVVEATRDRGAVAEYGRARTIIRGAGIVH